MVNLFRLVVLVAICALCSCNQSNKPLYRIQENGLYGFIDSTGTVAIEPQYKYVSGFNLYGYATVITEYSLKTEKDKYGSIDTLLHIKYGFIDKSNSLVVDTIHTMDLSYEQLQMLEIQFIYKKNAINFAKGMSEFNNRIDGGVIQLRAGQFPVQNHKSKLLGFMNLKGDTTIAAKYSACRPFYNGVASVSLKRELVQNMDDFIESLNTFILIDSLGNELTKDKYFTIPNFGGIDYSWSAKLIKDEENTPQVIWLLLDKKGKNCSDTVRCTRVYNSASDFYIWQQDFFGTPIYSYINKKGTWMTDFDHDGAITFFEETFNDVTEFVDTIAGVRVRYNDDPCWTFVNKKFEFISQPFDSVSTFNDGLVAVKDFSTDKKSTKWGFVDKKFEQVIPYKYDKVGSFVKGLAYFKIGNIEGYINKSGKVIWSHTLI